MVQAKGAYAESQEWLPGLGFGRHYFLVFTSSESHLEVYERTTLGISLHIICAQGTSVPLIQSVHLLHMVVYKFLGLGVIKEDGEAIVV